MTALNDFPADNPLLTESLRRQMLIFHQRFKECATRMGCSIEVVHEIARGSRSVSDGERSAVLGFLADCLDRATGEELELVSEIQNPKLLEIVQRRECALAFTSFVDIVNALSEAGYLFPEWAFRLGALGNARWRIEAHLLDGSARGWLTRIPERVAQ